jgi:N-acetylglucosaminyldiphosphoundecaprenol N-acetyl-beta-D-mannosaminyltransferase
MKESLLGYDVDSGSLAEIVAAIVESLTCAQSRGVLACLNPHSYVVALRDHQFASALRASEWLVPDGIGIVLASRVLRGTIRDRVSGPDVFAALHQQANRLRGVRVFFLGGTPETLERIRGRMEVEFPNIRVAGTYSPPFKPNYSEDESRAMTEAVNASRADVLWVGLTAPKQEKWIHEHKNRLNVRFIGAVGAAFDFYAGTVKPSPSFFRTHGLEWLPRLVRQPRRLWRRTFISAPVFVWHVLRARLRATN